MLSKEKRQIFANQKNTLFMRIEALAYFCSPGLPTELLGDPILPAGRVLEVKRQLRGLSFVCGSLRPSAVNYLMP